MEQMTLEEQIKKVAKLRKDKGVLKQLYDAAYQEFIDSHLILVNSVTAATENLNQAETELREITLLEYFENGNKKPAEGVSIRETIKPVYDPEVALEWAKEHKLALIPESLDVKAFEKIVKTSTPDFVTLSIEPQATIATDLSKYLEEEIEAPF